MLGSMVKDQADRALTHLGGVLLLGLAIGAILSQNGLSDKPGTIHNGHARALC